MTACSDSPADPDAMAADGSFFVDAMTDAPPIDGTPPPDGAGIADSGSPQADSGLPQVDSGLIWTDAGFGLDGGGVTDSGGGVTDGGGGVTDGGPDGGGIDITTLCTDLCDELFGCFGLPPDPSCYTECGTDLLDCAGAELTALQACATGDCTDIDTCVNNVACVGGGTDPICGDGVCNGSDTCASCPGDCGVCNCGDGVCSPGECGSCAADCPAGCPSCAHDMCVEGVALAPTCEECVGMICAVDSFCCDTSWDSICVGEVVSVCNKTCPGSSVPDAGVPGLPDAATP